MEDTLGNIIILSFMIVVLVAIGVWLIYLLLKPSDEDGKEEN